MSPLERSTAAVLVVYRLPRPVDDLLASLVNCVGTVVVVDNSVAGHTDLSELAEHHGAHLVHGANVGALAGAYNRALMHPAIHDPSIRHVVFLDEDSDASALPALLADTETVHLLADARTGAVAPAYRDRATGLRGRYIELRKLWLHYFDRQFSDVRAVAFVINSMSVWRIDALRRVGRFNEALAIDHVDTEYCLRARQSGLKLYVHGGHEFAHSIGERQRFRFLGREMQAGGHDPARRYLIGRNTSWLARSWLWREPAFAFLCATRLAYEALGIVVAEEHRWAKLSALLRGALVGLTMPRAA